MMGINKKQRVLSLFQTNQFESALELCKALCVDQSEDGEVWQLLAIIHLQLGHFGDTVLSCQRALALQPHNPQIHNLHGYALQSQGNLTEAVTAYREALRLHPGYPDALNNLGNVALAQGKHAEAISCYRQVLKVAPQMVEAHNNLGNVLKAAGQLPEAIACYREALRLQPNYALAHYNLGNAFAVMNDLDNAVSSYRNALRIDPHYADANSSLGAALQIQGHVQEAIACYRQAIRLDPRSAGAHWNLACALLLVGEFTAGWEEYEWRWHVKDRPALSLLPYPVWDGSIAKRARLLLRAEQGFGDTIQFIRYARQARQRVGEIIFECPLPLVSLIANCEGVDRVHVQGEPLPMVDMQLPLLSLPRIFGTTLETVPASIPYLRAPVNHDALAGILSRDSARMKIGIVWAGRPVHATSSSRSRSCGLAEFMTIAQVPGVKIFSLQKGDCRNELSMSGATRAVVDLDPLLVDFADTAYAISQLDLIVSVDTAVAHLAGALGVPVWIVLPHAPEWRWLLGREDTPWYPTMRLFRQPRPGDWAAVFQQVVNAVAKQLCQ